MIGRWVDHAPALNDPALGVLIGLAPFRDC
jgi:hypothetical protein